MWIDNHCHLPPGADGDEVVHAAVDAGVLHLVDVGTDLASSRATVANAARHAEVSATVGVHPHDASGGVDDVEALLDRPGVVAVGEAGLDFHYDHSPRDVQAEVFAIQIDWAHDHDLPLVIHTREAWPETFAILDERGWPATTVMHCFTGGPEEARHCLDRGAHISFSGIVTFPNAPEVREAARACPLDRMLVETDSPYLAPVPHRGTRNQPAWVADVGAGIASLRGVAPEAIAEATTINARAVYGL